MASIINIYDYFKQKDFNIIDYDIMTDTIYFYLIDYNKMIEIIKIIDEVLKLQIERIAYYNNELYLKLVL